MHFNLKAVNGFQVCPQEDNSFSRSKGNINEIFELNEVKEEKLPQQISDFSDNGKSTLSNLYSFLWNSIFKENSEVQK